MAHSPFPGMDPYLEDPALFPDLHERLIGIIAEQLAPRLAPKYITELSTQIVVEQVGWDEDPLVAIPDVTVTQVKETAVAYAVSPVESVRVRVPMSIPTRVVSAYIRARENEKLVAVIEILSPVNKRAGNGRNEYLEKRATFLESRVHFIEIDLLRKFARMPFDGKLPRCDYLAVVCDGYQRPHCDAYPITLRQRLPALPIPLLKPDPSVPLDLQDALNTAYERARYDLRINYSIPPHPPLSTDDAEWATTLIKNELVK